MSKVSFRSSGVYFAIITEYMGWETPWASESDGPPFESGLHHYAVLFKF